MRTLALSIVCLILTVAFSQEAHAYIDPGSGSILLQLILGGFAGVVVVFKLYWQRLKVRAGSLKRIFRNDT